MTIGELIAELQKHDPSLLVVTSGYEGGLANIAVVGPTKILLNYWSSMSYSGPHETKSDALLLDEESDFEEATAIILRRSR